MHICVAAHIASADMAPLLHDGGAGLSAGYTGAPLTAVLIGELLRRGHRVHAVTLDYALPDATPPQVATGPNLRFEILAGRRRAWRPNGWRPGRALDSFSQERRAVAQAIAAQRPELVHAHWTYEFALGALATGLPHVITAHDSPRQVWRYTHSLYRALRWRMAIRALGQARCVTAVSDYLAAEVQPMAAVPVQVVPNPLAKGAYALGRERAAPGGARVAMVCNGWDRRKNPEAALQALALLRPSLPQAELHLYGNGFEPGGPAQAWAGAHGQGVGLHFHGPVPHAQLLRELSALDLLLHPALEESFGVVLAEAMAMGLPVVAGRASGAVPWVTGPSQWLVDVRSPEAIAAALREALSDPARYAAASRAGLERAAAFSVEAVVTRYLAHYDTALRQQPRRAA